MFLEPIECKQARDYLARGAALEAARVLLAAPEPRHRHIQRLLLDVQAVLLKKAEELFRQGQIAEAWTYIQTAGRCASLPAEAQPLAGHVAAAYQSLVHSRQHKEQRLLEARRHAAEGHLHTAAELVQGLSLPEAQALQDDLRRQSQRLARYLTQARDFLARGHDAAARECYRRARQIAPFDPEVVALGAELGARVPPAGQAASGPVGPPAPITDRNTVWRLDTWGVVLSADEISIGRAGGPAMLPLWGRLHWRHALLVRNRQRWQITPCRDSKGQLCPVRVDGNTLQAPALLTHGQHVQFDSGQPAWRFCQPLPELGTALLEAALPAPAGTPLLGAAAHKRIVLLADQLLIAPQGPAHLRIDHLPCRQMCLAWQPEGLVYEVEGGRAETELLSGMPADPPPQHVYLPSRIVLEGELEETEWLGRLMLQREPAEAMSLAIRPVEPAARAAGPSPGEPFR